MKIRNKNKFIAFLFIFGVALLFSTHPKSVSAASQKEIDNCIASGGSGLSFLGNCQNCPTDKVSNNGVCVDPIDTGPNSLPDATVSDFYNTPVSTAPSSTSSTRQFNYTLLESFPGFYDADTEMTDFPAMVLAIYKFGIWTVGIAGLFMLVIGGIMYMGSAGNTSTAGDAKGIVTDALIGIVAALGAYLILYVINPDLIKINLDFTSVNVEENDFGGTLENDRGNQLTSGGCIKPVNEARQRKSWVYDQNLRGQTVNGITYTDCSNFIEASYKAAGCSSPGSNTASMYQKGISWSNKNDLKAGDAVVRSGHTVLCMDDGCSQIIHAPGKGKPITVKNGDWVTSKSGSWANSKVIKAGNYCGGC